MAMPAARVAAFSLAAALSLLPAGASRAAGPLEVVLVEPDAVSEGQCAAWKKEGFVAVALVLNERSDAPTLRKAAEEATAHALELYLWVEVGRCPELARDHPEWVASLGMHEDWRARFPNIRPLEKGEVAKAWPWVPVGYKESFDAHRARVARLLGRAPAGVRGILLNDLQGGPSSCGCGNVQCRWAVDYGVPSTATKLAGNDAAARFVAEVAKDAKGMRVIPVWTTECEHEDLPDSNRPAGSWGTGYCGGVSCFDTCRKRFAERWQALNAGRDGPTGVLALHREFRRDRKEYGGPAGWVTRAVEYCDKQGGGRPLPRARLWVVVQGYDVPTGEETAARAVALKSGAGAVVVARTRIDQSYEPRVVKAPGRTP